MFIFLITIMACILEIFCGLILCLLSFLTFYVFAYFIRSIWITIFFHSYIYKLVVINCCTFNEFDKTWIEYNTSKYLFIYIFEKFKILSLSFYKIYIFRCLILIFFLNYYHYLMWIAYLVKFSSEVTKKIIWFSNIFLKREKL